MLPLSHYLLSIGALCYECHGLDSSIRNCSSHLIHHRYCTFRVQNDRRSSDGSNHEIAHLVPTAIDSFWSTRKLAQLLFNNEKDGNEGQARSWKNVISSEEFLSYPVAGTGRLYRR
jgi:hypothetical protein